MSCKVLRDRDRGAKKALERSKRRGNGRGAHKYLILNGLQRPGSAEP